MSADFVVTGLVSPTTTRRSALAAQWRIPEYSSTDQVDMTQVDIVAISVPTSQNAAVLRKVKAAGVKVKILIDTPIASNLRELAACSDALGGFDYVGVAEDYMNFPPHTLMRRAVEAGLIGTPKCLTLSNTGYLYHGTALIRSFVGFKPVISSSRMERLSQATAVKYKFDGFQAAVVGPYRRHLAGGNVIDGTKGTITEFEYDRTVGVESTFYLSPIRDAENVVGYAIDSAGMRLMLPELAAIRLMDFPNKSQNNLLRSWGLMQVFKSLADPGNFNRRYSARQALYDSFVSRLATRRLLPFDPFVSFGKDVLEPLTMLASLRTKLRLD